MLNQNKGDVICTQHQMVKSWLVNGAGFETSVAWARGAQAESGLTEEIFNILKWEASKGERLGDFEVAYQNHNIPDQWQHSFNILKTNKSTIENSFHGEAYQHHYWLYLDKYKDRIFRKKTELKEGKGS